jgi:hypothetical protein
MIVAINTRKIAEISNSIRVFIAQAQQVDVAL